MTLEKNEGKNIKCEGVQKVPQLMASQVQMKKREAEKGKEKKQQKFGRLVHRKDGGTTRTSLNSKTRRKWCNGGAPTRKE